MKAMLGIISPGVNSLVSERKNDSSGSAKEAALLASLRLLVTCFCVDRDVILALKASGQNSKALSPCAESD